MEWFWTTVSYFAFVAIGGLVTFVFFHWFAVGRQRAQATKRAREVQR